MKPLLLFVISIILLSCQKAEIHTKEHTQDNHTELKFAQSVKLSIKENSGTIIFDETLKPGEEQLLPSVVGSESLGYFIDEEFSSSKFSGFVRVYGSDGTEAGSAHGGEIRRNTGQLKASYKVINESSQPRRFLAYTTKSQNQLK